MTATEAQRDIHDEIVAGLIDRAERIHANANGHRGFNSVVAGEILGEFFLGDREFGATYEFQGLPDAKAADWHALVKQAFRYMHTGEVRFYAPDGTLLPVNVIP